MSCAFNSFLSKSKDEAINASQTSFSTIASFIELQNDTEIDETEFQASPIFREEVTFQEMLLTMLDKNAVQKSLNPFNKQYLSMENQILVLH